MPFGSEILGGILVGLGMAIPLLYESQISGASGYAAASLRPNNPSGRAGLYFVSGLVLAGLIWRFAGGHLSDAEESHLGFTGWILAGLLVGFGARLGRNSSQLAFTRESLVGLLRHLIIKSTDTAQSICLS